ncbi:hypothetical protein QBC40DRAFT_271690 [Triangularia verruculosa]|uniref:Uncharacterized protein n=1 Tax=Triangularia verruculosa TaxID=2587418 RepID=A0AAN6XSU7_9PEZI|nr:hypothetical protein QBC40DRAFT_271690 [Triangularia verruculosa]
MSNRSHTKVSVLTLRWADGSPGFQAECEALGRMFTDLFHYDVSHFAIPSLSSESLLLSRIAKHLINARVQPNPPLVIIHYGGHAGANNSKTNGKAEGLEWAAQESGGPTVDWSLIQNELAAFAPRITILLLLDCCHAAQPSKGMAARELKFHILAASGRREKTLSPGKGSFTAALIQEITALLAEKGVVDISTLHYRLLHEGILFGTPVYSCPGGPMRLEPKSVTLITKLRIRRVAWLCF